MLLGNVDFESKLGITQLPGCEATTRSWGITTIRPACIGGVGMLGCNNFEGCRPVIDARSEVEVTETLVDLHGLDDGDQQTQSGGGQNA